MNLLTAILSLPFLAALLLALIPRNYRFVIRVLTLASTLATAALAIALFVQFKTGSTDYQFVQTFPWLPSLGIALKFGVDGINIGLIVMGTLVAFAAACVSWEIKSHEKTFYILLLIMSGGIVAAFASLDLFFFYFFHELALVPTFIMIGVWGRGENKNYATFQITIYLTVGALIALAGLIALYLQMPAAVRTFDIPQMTKYFANETTAISGSAQHFIFPLLMFGFGILVSLWPFHSWAPLGYGAAPSATAMLHAGVLKKFGLYGLIRIAIPMMPQGAKHWLELLALLCLGNILYVGWVAMRQRDFNLLLGNSSVAHMGFAFLGIASLTLVGVTGTVVLMVAHGLLAALSFGLSGYLYQHAGTLDMRQFGGLLKRLPFIGTALVMVAFAGCGLPGFGNFAGELMVLFGAWKSKTPDGLNLQNFVVIAAWGGLVVGALYALRAVRQMLHGQLLEKWNALSDANAWRKLPFCLLLAGLFAIGCWPRLLTDKVKPSAETILALGGGEKFVVPPVDSGNAPASTNRARRSNPNRPATNAPTARPIPTRSTPVTLERTSAPVAPTNSSK